jgi:hypothetical protein
MNALCRCLVLLVIACAVPGSTYVLGQAGNLTVLITGEPPVEAKQKKALEPQAKKALDAGKKEPPKKAVVVMKAMALQPARVVGRVMARPAAAALDAQAAQYVEQFRPLFRSEYYFIRNICGLTSEQRKKLARLGERATHAAARQFAESQQKLMQGGWQFGSENPDPQKIIEDELSKLAKSLLSAEQQIRYQQEREARAASRRQTFIDNLVAKLDADLVLTTQQRDRLVKAILANWNNAWGQSLQMLQNLDSFFPNIPDQVVTPILTDNQKEVWRRIPRNQNVFWGFSVGGVMMGNDPLEDAELLEAQKEAELAEKKK